MKRFFTSDLHFGHRNVIEYCDRPYKDIYEMNTAIINQWNSQVKPEDEVYVLGDFGINKSKVFDKELVQSLNGKKYLILGNHDCGFNTWHKDLTKFKQKWGNKFKDAGWHFTEGALSRILKDGTKVLMCHLPPDNGVHDNRYSQYKLPNRPDKIYLHGHLHGHYRKKNNMVDVCFDGDLKLLTEDEVIDIIHDERDFIPTRLTDKYNKKTCLMLMPFEEEVKKKNVRSVFNNNLILYNYTDQCTYERAWNEITRNSRGIIFERDTGKIVALPFPKFFNIGEMPETRLENLPNEPYKVTEKMDGSLGIVYHYNDDWHVATRGSFTSDQAKRGKEILDTQYDMSAVKESITLLVEIIYPENKIVANYGEQTKLVLLAMSDRDKQFEYSRESVEFIGKVTEMPVVKEYDYTIEEMIELQKTLPKDEEGFVVRFESGLRVKIKGEEYLRIHKMISHMSPISFWQSMKDGKVDVKYLEELPEEYRKEADLIKSKLEAKFNTVGIEIMTDILTIINCIGDGDIKDSEYRKKVGICVNGMNLKHSAAIFPALLQKKESLDKYILKKIRPNNNIL